MNTTRHVWVRCTGERCEVCGHRYALDIEYRCVGCDRGVCALCFVHVHERSTGYCSECGPESEGEAG